MKALVINTYAGSLLLAAQQAKMDVVASLEDCGFGSDLQALNFPGVQLHENVADWPDRFKGTSWSDTLTIAHPPCAAFSNQNQLRQKRGINTAAFACHTSVMDYALGNGTAALAIESVPGALAGAREVYEQYAAKHGYSVYFVLQNAVSFGVPQWRPRFWALFVRKKTLRLQLKPRYRLLQDVVTGKGHLFGDTLAPHKRVADILREYRTDEWHGSLFVNLEREDGLERDVNFMNVREKHNLVGFFTTAMPRWFHPNEFATTVLAESFWFMGGTELTQQDICAVMGFPREYKFGKKQSQFRTYLSKGICPPVGAWVLDQLERNVRKGSSDADFPEEALIHTLKPGDVCDLQPKKADALEAARQRKLPLKGGR